MRREYYFITDSLVYFSKNSLTPRRDYKSYFDGPKEDSEVADAFTVVVMCSVKGFPMNSVGFCL